MKYQMLAAVLLISCLGAASAEERVVSESAKQIQKLKEQMEEAERLYKQRPRRKFVGASIVDPMLSDYVKKCWESIEQGASKYYPTKSTGGLSGRVMVTANFQPDGKLVGYEITKSSDVPELDAVTRRILDNFTYCSPFSESIKTEIDILLLTKTWTYGQFYKVVSNDHLLWGKMEFLDIWVDEHGIVTSVEVPKPRGEWHQQAADAVINRRISSLVRLGQIGLAKKIIIVEFVRNDQPRDNELNGQGIR